MSPLFRQLWPRLLAVVLLVIAWDFVFVPFFHPTSAQVRGSLDLVAPAVIAGSDLGFRVESTKGDIAVGKFVVRLNGRWIDAQVGNGGVLPVDAK